MYSPVSWTVSNNKLWADRDRGRSLKLRGELMANLFLSLNYFFYLRLNTLERVLLGNLQVKIKKKVWEYENLYSEQQFDAWFIQTKTSLGVPKVVSTLNEEWQCGKPFDVQSKFRCYHRTENHLYIYVFSLFRRSSDLHRCLFTWNLFLLRNFENWN